MQLQNRFHTWWILKLDVHNDKFFCFETELHLISSIHISTCNLWFMGVSLYFNCFKNVFILYNLSVLLFFSCSKCILVFRDYFLKGPGPCCVQRLWSVHQCYSCFEDNLNIENLMWHFLDSQCTTLFPGYMVKCLNFSMYVVTFTVKLIKTQPLLTDNTITSKWSIQAKFSMGIPLISWNSSSVTFNCLYWRVRVCKLHQRNST